MTTTIWHHPRCSKSRATLDLLHKNGVQPLVRLYLNDPPNEAELRAVVTRLGLPLSDLVRKTENAYRDLALAEPPSEEDLIAAMVAHPILIERPIVIHGDRAAIGRPPEAVLGLL